MQTKILAHRGSTDVYLENTLAAFNQAVKDNVDGIELDIHRTIDGELVVFHDANLKRLTGKDQVIWNTKWSDIKKLILLPNLTEQEEVDFFHRKIPRLKDVLNLLKNTDLLINIELKNSLNYYPKMEEEVISLVDKFTMKNRVLYSSFNHMSMNKISSLIGPEHSAILTNNIDYSPWNYMKEIDISNYHPSVNSLQQPNLVNNIQNNEFKINIWTVDRNEQIYKSLLLGVDGIITNKPKKAIKLRSQFEKDNGKKALEYISNLNYPII